MMLQLSWLKNIHKSRKVSQVISLYTSMIIGVFLGVGVGVVNTRLLGPQAYGDLKFLQGIFDFLAPFMSFGIFVTGSRSLALSINVQSQQNITGVLLLFAALISLFYIFILFCFSFVQNNIFNNDLGNIIRIMSPLLFVFLLQKPLDQILEGANKIYKLSFFRICPRIFYICFAVLISIITSLTVLTALFLQTIAILLPLLIIVISLKPSFTDPRRYTSEILRNNKSHGLQVFFGSLFGLSTRQLIVILIGYYIDNVNVGYYSLAFATAMPLTLIPNAVSQTYYKTFVRIHSIPFKPTMVAVTSSFFILIAYLFCIKSLIIILYSSQYLEAVPLAYILSISCVIRGIGDYFNRFIIAHGKGSMARNVAFAVGTVNILASPPMIKTFGVTGAATTFLLSSSVYLACVIYNYLILIRKYQQVAIGDISFFS